MEPYFGWASLDASRLAHQKSPSEWAVHPSWHLLKTAIALAAVLASPVLAAPPQSLDAARAFLTRLYTDYPQDRPPDHLGQQRTAVFAPRLLDLMELDAEAADAKGEVGILDGDPVCDCQDPSGLKLQRLRVIPTGRARLRAKVLLRLAGETRRLTFELEDHGQGWRIADVSSGNSPSLVRLLEEGLREQRIALPAGQ
jgi:hypothetical protein